MKKNELYHSHLKVRAACKRAVCAINDNPSALQGIYASNVKSIKPDNSYKSMREYGFISVLLVFATKLLGAFH